MGVWGWWGSREWVGRECWGPGGGGGLGLVGSRGR